MTDDQTPVDPERPSDDEDRVRALLRDASGRMQVGDPFSVIYAVRRRVRRRRVLRGAGIGCTALAVGAASVLVAVGGPGSHRPLHATTAAPSRMTGELVSFNACNDYLSYVRAQAAALVGPYGLQAQGPLGYASASNGAARSPSLLSPAAAQEALASGAASAGGTVGHSGTNDQVAGVDEPDTVKTDGRIVVTLAGPTLRVLDTNARVIGSLQINGDIGGGVLLVGDRAVVLSSSSQPPSLALGFGGPGYYPSGTATSPAVARAAVIDLSVPTQPRLVRTFDFDGAVVAARLVGDQIRLVLRSDGPRLAFQTPTSTGDTDAATAANRALVANSTVEDWLPAWQAQNPDGSTTARRPLASCDAVARPGDASGISTVSVLTLDPQRSTPGPATSVVAAGDTVYATADHLYVAGMTTDPVSPPASGAAATPCCSANKPAHVQTRLYAFETSDTDQPRFVGAGVVEGSLLDSYAMDQDTHGDLRVASTVAGTAGITDSRITVLAPSGQALTPLGVVTGLGHGQQLRAVRFLGDAAYVVTFQTFDPLYVIDLRDPTKPAVAGQLEQPGFSEFLYPLPGGRLLGVGVEITNNEPSGLLVATYDVTDPAHPRRLQASELASGAQAAYGGYDPHAFMYWPPAALAILSLPGIAAGPGPGPTGAAAYRIGQDGSLTRIATLAHGTFTPTRTAVIGTQVWAFTSSGVITSDLATLKATSWHRY